MKSEVLIVVDAWKDCEGEDQIKYPYLATETKIFGQYLNYMCGHIRSKYDIIHCSGNKDIMDEIDTSEDSVIRWIEDVPDYKRYYFCGFHVGRCINARIQGLDEWHIKTRKERHNKGMVMNLSMLFPADCYNMVLRHERFIPDSYMYSHLTGFERFKLY